MHNCNSQRCTVGFLPHYSGWPLLELAAQQRGRYHLQILLLLPIITPKTFVLVYRLLMKNEILLLECQE